MAANIQQAIGSTTGAYSGRVDPVRRVAGVGRVARGGRVAPVGRVASIGRAGPGNNGLVPLGSVNTREAVFKLYTDFPVELQGMIAEQTIVRPAVHYFGVHKSQVVSWSLGLSRPWRIILVVTPRGRDRSLWRDWPEKFRGIGYAPFDKALELLRRQAVRIRLTRGFAEIFPQTDLVCFDFPRKLVNGHPVNILWATNTISDRTAIVETLRPFRKIAFFWDQAWQPARTAQPGVQANGGVPQAPLPQAFPPAPNAVVHAIHNSNSLIPFPCLCPNGPAATRHMQYLSLCPHEVVHFLSHFSNLEEVYIINRSVLKRSKSYVMEQYAAWYWSEVNKGERYLQNSWGQPGFNVAMPQLFHNTRGELYPLPIRQPRQGEVALARVAQFEAEGLLRGIAKCYINNLTNVPNLPNNHKRSKVKWGILIEPR